MQHKFIFIYRENVYFVAVHFLDAHLVSQSQRWNFYNLYHPECANISDIPQIYLTHISTISQPYLSHISTISQANMQVCMDASMQVCKYSSIQECKYASMQVCKYASMQVFKNASMQV